MPDMLVKLYNLPDAGRYVRKMEASGIEIRRAIPPEKHVVVGWVTRNFKRCSGWKSECDVSFSNKPVSCFIATHGKKIVGFACYEATCRGFFGPMGVKKSYQKRGIGKALTIRCLHAMRELGYAYAIIGWVGSADFYRKVCGAEEIRDSEPGFYKGMLE